MRYKDTIAVVGATGSIGSAIAKKLFRKYRLLLMSPDEAKLVDLKSELTRLQPETEVLAVSCAREASWEADIIIVATPYESEKEVAEKIREVATGKIVISIANRLNTPHNELVSAGTSAAEELQRLLPYSKVVKTFNTTLAADLIHSTGNNEMVDAFIAGNNGDAVETVSQIVAATGLNPIVVGDLTVSRTLERMQSMLIRLTRKHIEHRH